MIFDKLCGLIERHLPKLVPVLRQAQLFVFEGSARKDLPKTYTEEELREFETTFTLPFPITAIEDSISCILFEDYEERQIGVHTRRKFIECTPVDREAIFAASVYEPGETEAALRQAEEMVQRIRERWGEVYTVTTGTMEMRPGPTSNHLSGDVTGSFFMNKKQASLLPHDIAKKHDQATIINVSAGMEELIALNNIDRFVVERTPEVRPHCSRVARALRHRLPRSHQRPLYTLLTPKQIFEKFGVSSEVQRPTGGRDDRSLWRRRHWRHYRHDRYTEERRSKPQLIDAIWVGPSEAKIGKHRYKVRLDL